MAQLSLAFEAFKVEKGKYPLSLDELTPKYISKIPETTVLDEPIDYNSVCKHMDERKNIVLEKKLKDKKINPKSVAEKLKILN